MERKSHRDEEGAGAPRPPACDSALVQPTGWKQAGDRGHWRLWRRCPDCEWHGSGVYGDTAIDAYDDELDAGTDVLARNLREIERQNMEWMTAAFAIALAEDLITADDFGQA